MLSGRRLGFNAVSPRRRADLPVVRRLEAREDPQQRRLAAARRPEQREELARAISSRQRRRP